MEIRAKMDSGESVVKGIARNMRMRVLEKRPDLLRELWPKKSFPRNKCS